MLPNAPLTLIQIAIGVCDLTVVSLAMYALLPTQPPLAFFPLLVTFVMATLLGFVSHAPGGIGVFDAAMLIGLPLFEKEQLLAALLILLNNCVKGWNAATHDWIVIADSNVLMPRDYTHRLLASWQDTTGLVCAPPIGSRPQNFWAEIECAFLNTYQARVQYFADTIGLGFAQGKTLFWRRAVLDDAGGIRRLAVDLAEDAAATKVVRAAGLKVRLVDRPFEQPLGYRTALDVWRRQSRWARLRRASFPLFFLPEICAGALFPTIALGFVVNVLDGPVAPAGLVFLLVWYGGEMLLAHAARWHLPRLYPLQALLRDLLLPALWIDGLFGSKFEWRGNAMSVLSDSRTA